MVRVSLVVMLMMVVGGFSESARAGNQTAQCQGAGEWIEAGEGDLGDRRNLPKAVFV